MSEEARWKYAQYIRAQLINNDKLRGIFGSNSPTEKEFREHSKKVKHHIEQSIPSFRAVANLFRNREIVSTAPTLNYTAELFQLKYKDLYLFNQALSNEEIGDDDLKIKDSINDSIEPTNYDFTHLIEKYVELRNDRLPVFIGRKFVFREFDSFIGKNTKGYLFLKADAGVGKTSLALKYADDKNYLFHSIRTQKNGTGITTKDFLQNICAQLITRYDVQIKELPDDFDRDGGFLDSILRIASEKISSKEKIVVVVDGIDELVQEELTFFTKTNILYLPEHLPPNIFFILTMRRIDDGFKKIQLPAGEEYLIENEGEDNIDDVRKYIKLRSKEDGVKDYLKRHKTAPKTFLKTIEGKSEGNFMYLKHIFDEITDGDYQDKTLTEIPKGLKGYFKEHWDRMMAVSNEVKEVKLKTIYVLANMKKPISSEFLTNIVKSSDSNITNLQIEEVLDQWQQFLTETNQKGDAEYTFYHKSFTDFLASTKMIKATGVDNREIKNIIADHLLNNINSTIKN